MLIVLLIKEVNQMKGGGLYSIIMLVVMFAIMYFLLIRPQKKQQQQWQNMINNLKKGDHVITRGGLHGVIDSIDKANKTITLDCDGIFLLFSLSAIGSVQPAPQSEAITDEQPVEEKADDSDNKGTDKNKEDK